MKTLIKFIDRIHKSGRIPQDMTKAEMIECLNVIANDIAQGKTTLLHSNTLYAIRNGLMTPAEKMIDEVKTLGEMASMMGKKGGASKSDAKKRSSAENGKKGGRPSKLSKPDKNGEMSGHRS